MNEVEIVKGCVGGDNLARRRLYEQYAGLLMAVCVRYVGEREVAQDVLHDVFLQAFRSFDRFTWRGEGSLKAWLVRIAVNLSMEYLRRRPLFAEMADGVEALPDAPSDEEDLDSVPASVLMEFIRQLPDGYRTVFNLYVFEGKGHREIAALLGITEHSSSSQLHRARAILIKKITDYKKRRQ